jgi:hypothetical protein
LKLNLKASCASSLNVSFYYLVLLLDCKCADVRLLQDFSELWVAIVKYLELLLDLFDLLLLRDFLVVV